MCGRIVFTFNIKPEQLAKTFGLSIKETIEHTEKILSVDQKPFVGSRGNNIGPGNMVFGIGFNPTTKAPSLGTFRWGYKPNSSRYNIFNLKGDAIQDSPYEDNKQAFKWRRCLLLAEGFIEWTKDKQPYFFTDPKNHLMAIGSVFKQVNGEKAIIPLTREATNEVKEIHDRMPLLLTSKADVDLWINPWSDLNQVSDLLEVNRPILKFPLNRSINNPNNVFERVPLISSL